MTLRRTDIEPKDRQSEDGRSADMVWIAGGTFRMGSDHHYAEEAPVHRASVDGFWIDRTPVTNRQFKVFVKATRPQDLCRDPAQPKRLPRRVAAHALCRFAGVRTATACHRFARLEPVVDLHEGRRLVASLRAEEGRVKAVSRRRRGRASRQPRGRPIAGLLRNRPLCRGGTAAS
jgi:formylglycine-generating enzyme required for sulfatase activity